MIDPVKVVQFLAIIERLVSFLILSFFVLPRAWKNIGHASEYRLLRIGTFFSIFYYTTTNLAVFINNSCFFWCLSPKHMWILSFYNATGAVFISLALLYVYTKYHK